jgi:hypothetical protein
MSVTVYWSCLEEEGDRAKPPESLAKIFYKKNLHDSSDPLLRINQCPFFNKTILNTFSLKSIYDYSFKIIDDSVFSENFDQNFFEKHVGVRSIEKKFFSFSQKYVFFTEEKSLIANLSQFPFLEDNNITERCIVLGGKIDIGKYFRETDMAFFLKEKFNEFVIKNDEIFAYVTFETNEKINFKRFDCSPKLSNYLLKSKKSNKNKKAFYTDVDSFYNNFLYKKNIIKEIKQNLV